MKSNTSEKQIRAALAAVNEVEQLAERIKMRTEAPKLLWQKRHQEHAQLVDELKSESFDPTAESSREALRLHADRVTKVEAFNRLFEGQPHVYPIDYGKDGRPLLEAITKLQQLLWALAEPFELRFATLRKHGVFALSPNGYTPAGGATRLIAFARNFPLEAAGHLVSLANEILSHRVPVLPPDFGTVGRELTYSETQLIASRSTPVTAAA